MAHIQKTITIRYTPASRTIVYDKLDHLMSPTDASEILRTLNRAKISTQAPSKPKSGEAYVYRAKIIGKSWRIDGYERCWRSNGTHYYPKFRSLDAAKQNALFKVLRHVAFDKEKNEKTRFSRVAFVEVPNEEKENPLVIVHYFGDENVCVVPNKPTPRLCGVSNIRRSNRTSRSTPCRHQPRIRESVCIVPQGSEGQLIETSQCEVIVDHPHQQSMEIQDNSEASSATAPGLGNFSSTLDEDLREASAQGDEERVRNLLASGANVKSANSVNGWTALHWAAKRDHAHIVSLLLGAGADPSAKSTAGKSAADVCASPKLAKLLNSFSGLSDSPAGGTEQLDSAEPDVPLAAASTLSANSTTFVPNYLRNPEFYYARRSAGTAAAAAAGGGGAAEAQRDLLASRQSLLLLARVAKSRDPDFIEVELGNRSYEHLMELLCQELGHDLASVERIRKLPNVRLRNDADVGRLENGQRLELVLRTI